MPTLIGKPAPQFVAKAIVKGKIVSDFSLSQYLGRYVLFFFYPLDFTFVCPTELRGFQDYLEDFHQRNAEVIGCSVDSCYSHLAWLGTPKNKGGIDNVTYPLVSDLNKTIAKHFDVLMEEEGIAYRGLFLVDTKGIIRHQVVNDFPLGRSIEEALRILDALIYFENNGEVCPANWQQGKKALEPSYEGLEKYFATSVIKN